LQLLKNVRVIILKKGDIMIGAVAVAAAGILYFSGVLRPEGEGAKAIVTIDGKVHSEYNLDKEETINIDIPDVGYNSFRIKNGKVDMLEADCRDGICVDHTPISLNGETIICLPHRLVIEIDGGESPAIDGATK